MPCKKKEIPQPPENADELDYNKKPINNKCGPITFGWVRPIVKSVKKRKAMYYCDIYPLSDELKSQKNGKQIAKQWNITATEYQKKRKNVKNPKNMHPAGILTMLHRQCWPNFVGMYITVILTSLCNVCLPICLRQFTSVLTPSFFYDCNSIFSSSPQIVTYPYADGLNNLMLELYGYLLLIIFSLCLTACFQNLSYHLMGRVMIRFTTGTMDFMYQKMLTLSEQARTNAASGNITNLLFTDSNNIQLLLQFMPLVIQIPIDMIIYIIYLVIEVNPISLSGLIILVVIIPIMLCLLQGILKVSKRSLALKDSRVEKTTEVLNGIKVIKLFGLEPVQEARINNVRKKEMSNLYQRSLFMTLLNMFPSLLAPLMSSIAFIVLMYTNQFELTTAFTTMFLLQYLAFSMVLIPMLMGFVVESTVSSKRICAFLNMSEQDPGVVVRANTLTQEQKDKISNIVGEDDAIKITGNPSFTWSLAEDKVVPDILDPFFKENASKIKIMKRQYPRIQRNYKQKIQKMETLIREDPILQDNEKNMLLELEKEPDLNVLEQWCVNLKVPSLIRTTKVTQYNAKKYASNHKDSQIQMLQRQVIHLQVMKKLIAKAQGSDCVDDSPVLKNIDISIKKGELIGLCGPVGCSKSSLFTALLGDMRLVRENREEVDKYKIGEYKPQHFDYAPSVAEIMHSRKKKQNLNSDQDDPRLNNNMPHIYINGNVAYFQQACSILSRTVQDNIIFGKPYDKKKYDEIVRICCLEDDFKILQNGDQTLIGGKGVTLSGGQKARVTLARAIYSDSDIYLLDDPLSAVDSHVGQKLWSDVILGYLYKNKKTVIIASHQTQYFADCDRVIQMSEGNIVNFDTPENLIRKEAGIIGLQEQKSDAWNNIHNQENQQSLQNGEYDVKEVMNAEGDNVSEQTQSSQSQKAEDNAPKLNNVLKADKLTDTGAIKCSVYAHWCMNGSILLGALMFFGIVFNQAISQYQTVLVTHWSADEYGWSQSVVQDTPTLSCGTTTPEFCQQYGNMPIMAQQLIANGATPDDASMGLMKCYPEVGFNFDIQIKSSTTYLWLYFALTFGIMLFNYIGFQSLNAFCLFVSSKLHNKMLKSLIETKMSFFDTTEFGRITNRVSKDVDSLDLKISQFFMSVVQTFFQLIGMIITMAALSWPCLIIILPCIAIFISVFVDFRNLYPIVKRLEATSRSPVLNICQETIDNLITLKAYQSQEMMSRDFRKAVDINGSLFYQQFAIMRWMTFKLNILTAFFAFLICLVSCLLAPWNQQMAQYTGVIVSYSFSVTNLLFQFVQAFVQLEGEMSSTERLLEYSNLPVEGSYLVDVEVKTDNSRNKSTDSSTHSSGSQQNSNFIHQQRLIEQSVEQSSEQETVQQINDNIPDGLEMQNTIDAVEQQIQKTELDQPQQQQEGPVKIPQGWPRPNSKIEIRHLNFRYRPELELTLHDVTFTIQPGEHIGVVGRTGAGKSSITVALYRLAEPEPGTEIMVDGVNILNLGLHQARSAFTIIPQEPFLFSGTIRQSLCPYSQAEAEGADTTGLTRIPDAELWRVLNHVGLQSYMKSVPGGLEATVATNGDNLSAGQRQLVCVARALLRHSALAILDEATAAVDRETDQLIQKAVREALKDTAVLSIAHRLDTVIDFDKILVVDFGRVAEFDSPANLLRKSDSIFSQLVDNTGPEFSQYLRKCAFQAEEDRKNGVKTTMLKPDPGCQDLSLSKNNTDDKESRQSSLISKYCNTIDNSIRKDIISSNVNILTAEQSTMEQ